MRCGILTFHRAINYGAVMQAYALKTTLETIGVETRVIDYRSPSLEKHIIPVPTKMLIRPSYLKDLILHNRFVIDNRKNFEDFASKYLNLSSRNFKSIEELKATENEYDLFISGSDQVWSPSCVDFDEVYFLTFVEDTRKKASYAASLGTTQLPTEFIEQYKKRLSDFHSISLREDSMVGYFNDLLCRRDIQSNIDPVFLLGRKTWEKLSSPVHIPEKGYVLVYLMYEDPNAFELAKKIAKSEKIEVVYINDRYLNHLGVLNYKKVSPQEWLYLFINASYIITNSFHGTAFSIIMRKRFTVFQLPNGSLANDRITNLLDKLKLMNYASEKYSKEMLDYSEAENIINFEQKKALEYLHNLTLEEKYDKK